MANKSISTIEEILQFYTLPMGPDYNAYRNHVYRVYHLTLLLTQKDFTNRELGELQVASAFHDLGVWTHRSMDYLDPSIDLAANYCEDYGIDHQVVTTIIDHHHQLSTYKGKHSLLAEPFRRADLIDLSLGVIRFGLPKKFYSDLKAEFPTLGFHSLIYKKVFRFALQNLRNPFPMLKK